MYLKQSFSPNITMLADHTQDISSISPIASDHFQYFNYGRLQRYLNTFKSVIYEQFWVSDHTAEINAEEDMMMSSCVESTKLYLLPINLKKKRGCLTACASCIWRQIILLAMCLKAVQTFWYSDSMLTAHMSLDRSWQIAV